MVCNGFSIQLKQSRFFKECNQRRHHDQHGNQGKDDPCARNKSKLTKTTKVSHHQDVERSSCSQRTNRNSLASANKGLLNSLYNGFAKGTLFCIARIKMYPKVDPQPKQHKSECGRHQVEGFEPQEGNTKRPGKTHEQRYRNEQGKHRDSNQLRKQNSGREFPATPCTVAFEKEVQHNNKQHRAGARAKRAFHVVLDGFDFGELP